MKKLQLRNAKASLSALIEAAERGEATVVTKHGKPAAMIVPFEAGRRLYPDPMDKPSFADFLMSVPTDPEAERNPVPLRPAEL